MVSKKTRSVTEFGDWQTPDSLAGDVIHLLKNLIEEPNTIIEPSCGKGAFLVAAAAEFPNSRMIGLDVNGSYLRDAQERLKDNKNLSLIHQSFFAHDWESYLQNLPSPLLIVGNPPWVTNAELGSIGSDNLPEKTNFQNLKGFDALTGKSNFDISEWMLHQNIDWLVKTNGTLAVLCKTAVARKVITYCWKRHIKTADARIYKIDALASFGAAVDACLFFVHIDGIQENPTCKIFESINSGEPISEIGYMDNILVSNTENYTRYATLKGVNKAYTWRSGIKHDCSKVMELDQTVDGLINGLGETVDIEESYLYPLFKSSDIAGTKQIRREKFVIVTQKSVGEDTKQIESIAPKTWRYLQKHQDLLGKRGSIIYKNKPDYSIFGVGEYSFAPWKIAISGLYKKLTFKLYGSGAEKPVMFDDTAYFLPFDTHQEAVEVLDMLNSVEAQEFLESMVFWDEKRPITVELLKRLDINKLANLLGRSHTQSDARKTTGVYEKNRTSQMSLFSKVIEAV